MSRGSLSNTRERHRGVLLGKILFKVLMICCMQQPARRCSMFRTIERQIKLLSGYYTTQNEQVWNGHRHSCLEYVWTYSICTFGACKTAKRRSAGARSILCQQARAKNPWRMAKWLSIATQRPSLRWIIPKLGLRDQTYPFVLFSCRQIVDFDQQRTHFKGVVVASFWQHLQVILYFYHISVWFCVIVCYCHAQSSFFHDFLTCCTTYLRLIICTSVFGSPHPGIGPNWI